MPTVPPVVLAPLELHDHDLAPPRLPHHLGPDLRPVERRSAREHLAIAVDQEDVGELHGRAPVTRNLFHGDDLTRTDPVLLATGGDDRIHVSIPSLNHE